jgi:hypothetical protein
MPTDIEKNMGADLSALLEGLLKAGVDFVLVGGLAAVIQGAPFTTVDVDIVHDQSPENITKLLEFLESVDAIHRRPDDKIIEPKERDLSEKGHALFTTRLGPLDVLAFIEDDRAYADLLQNSVALEFRGYTIRVLELETMIQLKKISENPIDRQRLPVLEETLRQSKKFQVGG